MTKVELAEWRQHPVTQEIFNQVDDVLEQNRSQKRVRLNANASPSIEHTAMFSAWSDGWEEGIKALNDIYESGKEALNENHA